MCDVANPRNSVGNPGQADTSKQLLLGKLLRPRADTGSATSRIGSRRPLRLVGSGHFRSLRLGLAAHRQVGRGSATLLRLAGRVGPCRHRTDAAAYPLAMHDGAVSSGTNWVEIATLLGVLLTALFAGGYLPWPSVHLHDRRQSGAGNRVIAGIGRMPPDPGNFSGQKLAPKLPDEWDRENIRWASFASTILADFGLWAYPPSDTAL